MKYLTSIALLLVVTHAYAAGCGNDANKPYEFDAAYTADILANVEGGVRRQAAYLDNLDLTLSVDGDSALGWSNTCLFVYGLYNNGAHFSDGIVGDAQYVSSIETDVMAARLFEAWIQRRFPDERASLKMGLYDVNSEFDHVDTADLFINSAHGIDTAFGLSGKNGPSIFPVTSLALRGDMAVDNHWHVRAAVLDAVPGVPAHPKLTAIRLGDGTLSVVETTIAGGGRRAGLGYWRYSGTFESLSDGVPRRGNYGWYAFGEKVIAQVPSVSVFARVGHAREEFNQFRSYVGAGIVYRGAVTGSDKDALGFAVAWAQTGYPYRMATLGQANEVNLELTWHLQLSENVGVQPDLQYVINPGANRALGNALVVGLRATISLAPY